MNATSVAQRPVKEDHVHPYYHWSCLGSGLVRMWRGWRVTLVVVLVNAIVQALLITPSVGGSTSRAYDAFALVCSVVVLLFSALLLQSAAVESADGVATWGPTLPRIRTYGLRYVLWITLLAVLVVAGMLMYIWPGLIVPVVFPFLTVAAIAGESNPLAANFRVIAARPVRWAITMVIIGFVAAVVWLLMVANWFFVPTGVGAFVSCAVGGWLCWWWASSLTLVYVDVVRERPTPLVSNPVR